MIRPREGRADRTGARKRRRDVTEQVVEQDEEEDRPKEREVLLALRPDDIDADAVTDEIDARLGHVADTAGDELDLA